MKALGNCESPSRILSIVFVSICLTAVQACSGSEPTSQDVPAACTQGTCLKITEMWSHQFPGIVANGFKNYDSDTPTGPESEGGYLDSDAGTELEARRYILMAAREDNTAHFWVAVSSTGSTESAFVRLGLSLDGQTQLIGKSYQVQPDRMDLSIDLNDELPLAARLNGKPLSFYVFAGFDQNKNGALDEDEDIIGSKEHFLVVPEWYYNSSLSTLKRDATLFEFFKDEPLAVDFFRTFLSGQAPDYFHTRGLTRQSEAERIWTHIRATHETRNISVFNPVTERHAFSHKVGIDYGKRADGFIASYYFDEASSVTEKIRKSKLMRESVIPHLISSIKSGDFLPRFRIALRFDPDAEPELFHAFGTVYLDVSLNAPATCESGNLTLRSVRMGGTLHDLYDFNYESNTTDDLFKMAAAVQAGYGSFGSSGVGQVFLISINLNSSLPEFEGVSLGSCTGVPFIDTAPSIVGQWAVSTTYDRVCHGSLLRYRFFGTRHRRQDVFEGEEQYWPVLGPPVFENGFIYRNRLYYSRDPHESDGIDPTITPFPFHSQVGGEATIREGARQIDAMEYGLIVGEIDGIPGRCSASAKSIWTR